MKNNLLKKLGLTTIGVVSLSLGALFNTNTNFVHAYNKNQIVSVNKNAKDYVYANKSLSKIKSKNIKKTFGSNKLVVKKVNKMKEAGKQYFEYDYVVSKNNHKKSGWVYFKLIHADKKGSTKKNHKKSAYKKSLDKKFKEVMNKKQSESEPNNNSGKDAFGERTYNKNELVRKAEDKFINHVNKERIANGKEPLIQNSGLMKLAQERANYVDVNNSNAHTTTSDGKKHNDMAAFIDGQNMGIVHNDNLSESLLTFKTDESLDDDSLNDSISALNDLIDNDSSSGNGHRNILIGNHFGGQRYYGIGVKFHKNNNYYTISYVILQSDTNL